MIQLLQLLVILSAIPTFACGQDFSSDPQDADARELLQASVETLQFADHASFKVVVDLMDRRPDKVVPQLIETNVRRNGTMLDYAGFYRFPESPEKSWRFRLVVNENRFLQYFVKGKDGSDLSRPPSNGVTSEKRLEHAQRNLRWLQFGGVLDGYCDMAGGMRLPEVLLKASKIELVNREDVDGVECNQIRGSTDYGELQTWISTSPPNRLMRFHFTKHPGDIYETNIDGVVRKIGEAEPSDGNQYPASAEFRLEQVGYADVQGLPVCNHGVLFYETQYVDGTSNQRIYECSRSEIELRPDYAMSDAFQIDLPENAPINNWDHDDSGLRYVWRNHDVHLAYADFLAPATGTFSSLMRTRLLWTINAIVLFALGAWLLMQKRQKKDSSASSQPR